MRLKIASRRSDLARWQAVQVGRTLEQHPLKPQIDFIFKASLGDQNLDLPLASMGSKGVFTEDFYGDLINEQCDLVVHSWKDLPVDERESTHIAMTLPRADVRDLLLVPNAAWEKAALEGKLNVFTSSPRRIYNLGQCLSQLLPGNLKVEFHNVRGNVPTRLRKMHEAGYGLVLAKAGLDRLLAAEKDGFLKGETEIGPLIADCRFQVLPVSLNPPAPAQGALAVEILRKNQSVNSICDHFTHNQTSVAVRRERDVLKSYGGGCHQKIGVAVLPREYGQIFALRGLTTEGQVLNEWRLENSTPWTAALSANDIFPLQPKDNRWFERRPLQLKSDLQTCPGLFVARSEALPESAVVAPNQLVWTAGVQSWMRLAARGIWVNGCHDGLGEREEFGLDYLAPEVRFTKLTHSTGGGVGEVWPTYELKPLVSGPDLKGKTHFYWMSRTSYEEAKRRYPQEIAEGRHACGPGSTFDFLKSQKDLKYPVKVFINFEQFLAESLPR